MGAEAEVPKLPLFSPHELNKEMCTSPVHHHTSASVPFQWEKEPGKPNTVNLPINSNFKPKSLDPPPRLYSINTPSPTTVLDGPYNNNFSVKTKFSSSSFRFLKNISKAPETEQFVKRGNWWQRNVKRCKGGCNRSSSSAFLSSMVDSTGKCDERRSCSARMASFRRNGSSSNLSATKSHMIWAHIYEGFKKAIPWKSSKSKNCSSYSFQREQSI
ncbi:hypothetical protein HAX54_016331 [Datura stramonium]|uniref:Uncharacterized protein n=1 Tax=Datura stramonium TaxID=4076 RepID=A0ABS8UIS4_DATST|nr:hypothetical protein [Datura stramonium]